jgi:hypothetical protein
MGACCLHVHVCLRLIRPPNMSWRVHIHTHTRIRIHCTTINPHINHTPQQEKKLVFLHSAGDVEGHRSKTDRRFYLIDLARHLPAVIPRDGTKVG